jgi:hypothetical protein
MINIKQGEANIVVLTLNEKSTLTNPVYVFEFVNDTSGESKVFTAVDTSSAKWRYNQFTIKEDSVEDLENGIIHLPFTGFYSYTVYEFEATSPQSMDLEDAVSIVETGRVYVYNDATTYVEYQQEFKKDIKVYNG